MSKFDNTNEFINFVYDRAKIARGLTKEQAYSLIKNYRVDPSLQGKSIDPYVAEKIVTFKEYWTDEFKIDYSENDKYFEFKLVHRKFIKDYSYKGKLYISTKPEDLGTVSDMLIKTLISYDIASVVKVSKTYINDNIIVWFTNSDDVEAILDLIESDEIQKKLNVSTPFVPDILGVGFTLDDYNRSETYNERVSVYLSDYVNKAIRQNIGSISIKSMNKDYKVAISENKITEDEDIKLFLENLYQIIKTEEKDEEDNKKVKK